MQHRTEADQQRVFTILSIAISAALGGFLFGYDTAVINGAVSSIEATFQISASVLGFTVSSALLGSAAGAIGAGSQVRRERKEIETAAIQTPTLWEAT